MKDYTERLQKENKYLRNKLSRTLQKSENDLREWNNEKINSTSAFTGSKRNTPIFWDMFAQLPSDMKRNVFCLRLHF